VYLPGQFLLLIIINYYYLCIVSNRY